MSTDEWVTHWAEGRRGFHQSEVHPRLLENADWLLTGGGTVLVPLCGKTKDLRWLAGRGSVLGVEAVTQAIEEFLEDEGLTAICSESSGFRRWSTEGPTILQGDFFALDAGHTGALSAAWDRAALVAIRPARRRRYVERLVRLLGTGGRILLVTWDTERPRDQGPPYRLSGSDVVELYGEFAHVQQVHRLKTTADEDERVAAKGLDWVVQETYRITLR